MAARLIDRRTGSRPGPVVGGIAAAAILGLVGSAGAQVTPSDPFLWVHAQTSGGLDGWLTIPLASAGVLPTGYEWNLAVQGGNIPISINDTGTGTPIVTVTQLRSAVQTLVG